MPLVKHLQANGCKVLAISRNHSPDEDVSLISWLKADISDPKTYREKIELFQPEVVIHLAWQGIPDYSFSTSIKNLNNSLEFLSFVAHISSCKKILVSGSCWEFNITQGECLESIIGSPKDDFTWAKHALRSFLEMICKQEKIILGWLRLFYVYGPRQRTASLIPYMLNQIRKREFPAIRTPNDASDFIFIDDVVDAFFVATVKKIPAGIFNIGTGKSTSVLEVFRYAEGIVHNEDFLTKQLEIESQDRPSLVNFWAGTKITIERLGWEPKTPLQDGISKTWDYINHYDTT
jgi:nucleoside-diphosphate-sugar epimerase